MDHAENTASLFLGRRVVAPLHSNGRYSTVACVFVAAGMGLASRCLAMNVYSDFTISAFGRHVTISTYLFDYIAIIMLAE
jgi:hypothetical protein